MSSGPWEQNCFLTKCSCLDNGHLSSPTHGLSLDCRRRTYFTYQSKSKKKKKKKKKRSESRFGKKKKKDPRLRKWSFKKWTDQNWVYAAFIGAIQWCFERRDGARKKDFCAWKEWFNLGRDENTTYLIDCIWECAHIKRSKSLKENVMKQIIGSALICQSKNIPGKYAIRFRLHARMHCAHTLNLHTRKGLSASHQPTPHH